MFLSDISDGDLPAIRVGNGHSKDSFEDVREEPSVVGQRSMSGVGDHRLGRIHEVMDVQIVFRNATMTASTILRMDVGFTHRRKDRHSSNSRIVHPAPFPLVAVRLGHNTSRCEQQTHA